MLTAILQYLRGMFRLKMQSRSKFHRCMFRKGDVLDFSQVPKCMICGKELEEA